MNSRAFTLSLVIAGIAMFMTYTYIEGERLKMVEKYGKAETVVVAKQDIKELELIDDRKVKLITVPAKYVAKNSFRKVEEVFNTVATVPIQKGEQITKPRVTYPGARTGLSRQISIGKRAVAIPVSEDSAVSKLLKPGDRVDVMALMNYAGGRIDMMKVKTVLQDKFVLATGYNVTNSIPLVGIKSDTEVKKMKLSTYTSYNTVTLELTPFEAEKIIFLMNLGSGIYLSLRNNDDQSTERMSGTSLFDLLGEDAGAAKSYFLEKEAAQRQRRR